METRCKLTGLDLDLDRYGKTCNMSGQLKSISTIVEPILFELKRVRRMQDLNKIIIDAEKKINKIKNNAFKGEIKCNY